MQNANEQSLTRHLPLHSCVLVATSMALRALSKMLTLEKLSIEWGAHKYLCSTARHTTVVYMYSPKILASCMRSSNNKSNRNPCNS